MKDKKIFLKGVLLGLVISILSYTVLNSGISLYRKFVTKNISVEQKLKEIQYIIDKYYVNDVSQEELNEGLYSGVVSSLNDPYSYYMDETDFNQFLEDTNGNYVGIGVMISLDALDRITFVNIFENSPAQEAGIKVNDKLLSVDGVQVQNNYSDITNLIKGPEGTKVNLTLYRESEDKTFDVSVERKSIDIPTVSHKLLDDNIGYIKITQFDGVTYEQFKLAFENLEKQNSKGLIIDLRDNPGGLLNIVVKITDMLVPKGVITYVEDKYGEKRYEYSDENGYTKPLVILVNENSASASEVLSGAVKDFGIGKLVGETTYGKGVVQNIYKLSDGSGVKVTIAKYYTPNGICIDGTGIEPHYLIEQKEGLEYLSEDDIQFKKAIEVINNWN